MEGRHDFLRVLQGTKEGENSDNCENHTWCKNCLSDDGCKWCADAAGGQCQSSLDCSTSFITDDSTCPHGGADMVWKNISVLIGALLGLVICLNMVNRCSNRRRSQKLKKSIFRLPVYTYPSRERRATALREARSRLDASSRSTIDVDIEDGSSQGEEDSSVTCTICLASYEEEEVIKVLPCGHDFHAHCLDSWLELKAWCPLCKTPAFSKKRRETPRRNSREAQINAVNTVATESASGPGPRVAVTDSPSADHQTADGDIQTSGGDPALVRTATGPEIEETVAFVAGAEDDVDSMHRMENVRTNSIVARGDHDEACSADVGRGDNRDHDLRYGEVEQRVPLQESLTRSLVTRPESQS